MTKFAKNPIFIGSTIKTTVQIATSTLIANFVMNFSINAYTLQQMGASVLGLVTSIALMNKKFQDIIIRHFGVSLNNIAWENFKIFMLLEAIARAVCGLATLYTKTPTFVLIFSLLMTPYGTIQQLGINKLKSKIFKTLEERREFDDFDTKTSNVIGIVGFLFGFIVNYFCSEPAAFAICCVGEIVDNIFYLKAYKSVEDIAETEEDADEENEEDVEVTEA